MSGVAAALAATFFPGQAAGAPAPSSGFLNLCKQAAAGISAGDTFEFTIALSGVTRNVTVAAGACERLEVPREGSPSTKGSFRNHPSAGTRLIPGSAKVVVDAQQLSAEQVQAILGPAGIVRSQSSLLLNLTQQLLAADLNILRGVQPPVQASQAIADAKCGHSVTLGSAGQIQLATTLSATQMSALVKTLTGRRTGIGGAGTPLCSSVGQGEEPPRRSLWSLIDMPVACSTFCWCER